MNVSGERPAVAVLLGTDHHPFDRAVAWTVELASRDHRSWLLQHGYTVLPPDLPAHLATHEILAVDDLEPLLAAVDVVVTHGGPGLIMEARAAGHQPIVLPRDPEHGEHVDGHQQDFAARLAAAGMIRLVTSLDDLAEAVAEASRSPRPNAGAGGTNQETVAALAAAVEKARRTPRVSLGRRLGQRLRGR